jgi:hypothetical protein
MATSALTSTADDSQLPNAQMILSQSNSTKKIDAKKESEAQDAAVTNFEEQ